MASTPVKDNIKVKSEQVSSELDKSTRKYSVRKVVKISIIALATAVILQILAALILGLYYQHKHRDDPLRFGVSFSINQAQNFGLDWKATYLALLDDAGFKHVRLMSYWDSIEPKQGNYTYEDLDWLISQAEQRNVKVSLALGVRQPRYPECHAPPWLKYENETQFELLLLPYVANVVNRYKDSAAIESYQIENEAANTVFAKCFGFSQERISNEYNLVKKLDPLRPIIINASNQSGIPLSGQIGDKVGFSIYKKSNITVPWGRIYWNFWYVPSWWHAYRAEAVELLHGKSSIAHEVQAEPWGPQAIWEMSAEEQAKSMNPAQIKDSIQFTKNSGLHDIYLWGGEWWYWRMSTYKDPSTWNMVKQQIR